MSNLDKIILNFDDMDTGSIILEEVYIIKNND